MALAFRLQFDSYLGITRHSPCREHRSKSRKEELEEQSSHYWLASNIFRPSRMEQIDRVAEIPPLRTDRYRCME